jgi:membrane protein DedA with SNARE-associated domain
MVQNILLYWITQHGYIGLFSFLVLGVFAIPIPVETLLILAGFLISKGHFHFLPTIILAFLGTISGTTLGYGVGRFLGISFVRRFMRIIHFSEKNVQKVDVWFRCDGGKWTLMFGYFCPGIRHLTAIFAGSSKLGMPIFAFFAYLGGFVWSVSFILLGYGVGENGKIVLDRIYEHLFIGTALLMLVIAGYFLIQRRLRNWKNT